MNIEFKSTAKKVLKIFLPILICFIMMAVGAGIYHFNTHPNDYRYNDKFVLGNTKENIIQAYGEFDHIDINGDCGYFIHHIIPSEISYVIEFNDKEIATDVYLAFTDSNYRMRELSNIDKDTFLSELRKSERFERENRQ